MKKVEKTTRPFRYDLNQIPYDYTVEVRNRFKGLDMIDRGPDELWTEVHDIVQETGSKTIPKKKKCKKAKWLSEEVLQMAVKRWEAKSKGEMERYAHLNAEFQRIARRDKKAFLSDQCKEIEENNRVGKTRDLFKKIRDTKETFHAKMGSIKDRNGRHLTEADREGNGNPLQYSCLANPMDGGAWWAEVHRVSKSRMRLSEFTFVFTFMHWRRKWQPTPVFLPGESQGQGSLVGCRVWGRTESDMTEAT